MLGKSVKLAKFALSPFRQWSTDKSFRLRTAYAKALEKGSIQGSTIVYESYHGKSTTGNPYALFKAIQKHPNFKDFKHVWCVNDKNSESAAIMKTYKNVVIVKRETVEYVKYLAKAKYLINDTSFPYYFQKREGQVYINTWHGVPFKTIGADVKESKINAHGNIQRNLLQTDFLVSPNTFTHTKLIESNRVDGIFNGTIVESGYPRTDITMETNPLVMKQKIKIDKNKKVILYAPTWRESETNDKESSIENVYQEFKELKEKFSDEYEIILKVHYFIYNHFKQKGLEKYCIPDWVDTNELLSCVDILITDYSSIFFDFLHTGRPVLFYTYDREQYEMERGVYMRFEDLPGPLCQNLNELKHSIQHIEDVKEQYKENYEKMVQTYCYLDDGKASERIIDTIFQGKESECAYKLENGKKKLLIWGGGFDTNGITISLANLLNNIDYDTYDVSLIFASKLNATTLQNIKKINPNTKILYRVGKVNYKFHETYLHRLVMHFGLGNARIKKIMPKEMYQRELKRVIGNTDYDVVIDYCGYTPFWSLILSSSPFKKKNIYLHSDMVADSNKKINGKLRHKRNFEIIFNLYQQYNQLICVSKDAAKTNAEKLTKYNIRNKIVNVDNAIDYERVLNHLDEAKEQEFNGKNYLLINNPNESDILSLIGVEAPSKDNVNFVTVGRLSPEKDHEKLIKAFYEVNKSHENTRLYIVGHGVLQVQLESLIRKLGLTEKVILVGGMDNPFPLVERCDCFVLSSNYEGQGLAILESLILKKPVISTNISGPRGILENGYGELVENSASGLAEGMKQFITEDSNFKTFDYVGYNENAMKTFYTEVIE